MKHEGANARVMAKFYVATIQAILLYGSKSWVLTKKNLQKLNSFHLRAVRHMTGEHVRKKQDGTWEYPIHSALLTKCGLKPITEYITRRRTTLWTYLKNHQKDLLDEATRTRVPARHASKRLWWQQETYD